MGLINTVVNGVKSLFGSGIANSPAAQAARADAMARVSAGTTALRFYEGVIPAQLTVKPGQPDDNVAVNYAALIVEKGVSFLFGDELRTEIGDAGDDESDEGDDTADDTTEDETHEAYVDLVWSPDQRGEDLIDLATDGAVAGDAWAKISIQPDSSPLVSKLDPCTMSADTDPHDYRRVLCYRCQYPTFDAGGRRVLYKEETTREEGGQSWLIVEYLLYDDGQSWRRQPDETRWNYSFAPIFHCKNLPNSQSFYGRPDLTPYVLQLIKYISRVDSLIGRIVRVHAAPKPYAKGIAKQELDINTTGVMFLPTVDAELGLLEMTGDLEGALAYRRLLREALAEVSHVPEVASGKLDNIAQLSGLALKILYGPLIDRTRTKQRLYGRFIKDVVRALIIIGGRGEQTVTIHWPGMVPGDPKEEVETAIAKKQLGYSNDTLIQETGGDPDAERVKRQADDKQMGTKLLDAFDRGGTPDE